jgi:undecaprenyl pyrophosphate phosphatase UppP
MNDTKQNTQTTISWHFLNAGARLGLWFLALTFGVAVVVGLSPDTVRDSKLFAFVPFVLFVMLNFGAMFLASMRASKKAASLQSRHEA